LFWLLPSLAVASAGACAGPDEADVAAAPRALTAAQAAVLSDEFSGTALDPSWTIVNGAAASVSVHDGALHVVATGSSLWFNDALGVLIYKLVPGDFKATVTAHARKASNPSLPPDQSVELGGIMARNPVTSPENWIFAVVGFAEQGHLAVEHKDTVNSISTFNESPFPADADLRLCRQGTTVALYKRQVGTSSWGTPDYQSTRADLPQTLQVGPNMYAYETAPDLDVSFDRITFAPVSSLADCVTDTPVAGVPAVPPAALAAAAVILVAAGACARRARARPRV
jgi:hypothetical protein